MNNLTNTSPETQQQETTTLQLSTPNGLNKIRFHPPIESSKLFSMPHPQTEVRGIGLHAWTPIAVQYLEDGKTKSKAWLSEAFEYDDDRFIAYAQELADHIGNAVVSTELLADQSSQSGEDPIQYFYVDPPTEEDLARHNEIVAQIRGEE